MSVARYCMEGERKKYIEYHVQKDGGGGGGGGGREGEGERRREREREQSIITQEIHTFCTNRSTNHNTMSFSVTEGKFLQGNVPGAYNGKDIQLA